MSTSRPTSQSHNPPQTQPPQQQAQGLGPALQLTPPTSQYGGALSQSGGGVVSHTGVSHPHPTNPNVNAGAYADGYGYGYNYGYGYGYNYGYGYGFRAEQGKSRWSDNKFLLTTLIIGLAGWITCLVSQAIVTHDESNTPIGTLWFSLLVQLYILYLISMPSAQTSWVPSPPSPFPSPSPLSPSNQNPTTNPKRTNTFLSFKFTRKPPSLHREQITSQIPSTPPTLPPIIINHTPGSTLRAFSIRSRSSAGRSAGGRKSPFFIGDKEKGDTIQEEERRKSISMVLSPGVGNSGLSPGGRDSGLSPGAAAGPMKMQISTSGAAGAVGTPQSRFFEIPSPTTAAAAAAQQAQGGAAGQDGVPPPPVTSTPLQHPSALPGPSPASPPPQQTPLQNQTRNQPEPELQEEVVEEPPPDHPPLLIPLLALISLSLSIIGIETNIFSSDPARRAVAAGWIVGAGMDILWVWWFTSSTGSVPRRVMSLGKDREGKGGGGDGEVRDSKLAPVELWRPRGRRRLSKPPPAGYTPPTPRGSVGGVPQVPPLPVPQSPGANTGFANNAFPNPGSPNLNPAFPNPNFPPPNPNFTPISPSPYPISPNPTFNPTFTSFAPFPNPYQQPPFHPAYPTPTPIPQLLPQNPYTTFPSPPHSPISPNYQGEGGSWYPQPMPMHLVQPHAPFPPVSSSSPQNQSPSKTPKWKFLNLGFGGGEKEKDEEKEGKEGVFTTLPLRIRRRLTKRNRDGEKTMSSLIPVVVGAGRRVEEPQAAGEERGSGSAGESAQREEGERQSEGGREPITDRPRATSPQSLSSSSAAGSGAGRKGRRVSPPPVPPDLTHDAGGAGYVRSEATSPDTNGGEKRLSVVPEIPSIGTTPPGGVTSPPPTSPPPPTAPSATTAFGTAEAKSDAGTGSRISLTGSGRRARLSSSMDPEEARERRSAGVWGGVVSGGDEKSGGKEREGGKGEKREKLGHGWVAEGKDAALALYTYKGSDEDPNELSFTKGELLEILDSSGKWWDARREDGVVGVVPSNYVRMLS